MKIQIYDKVFFNINYYLFAKKIKNLWMQVTWTDLNDLNK